MRAVPERSPLVLPLLTLAAVLAAGCDAPDRPLSPLDPEAAAHPAASVSDMAVTKGFRKAVTVAGIRAHQAALQQIADANGGSRDAGSAGDAASIEYARGLLAAAGYDVSLQEVSFQFRGDASVPVLQTISPVPATYVHPTDFATMTFSGSGDVTAPVVAVDLVLPPPAGVSFSNSGCEPADFAGFPAGAIALLQRGTCDFDVKALNAVAAGAAGVIIFNEGGTPDRLGVVPGTLGDPNPAFKPTIGTTFAIGVALANGVLNGPTGYTARLMVDWVDEERTAYNLVADSRGGDASNVIVVGARLDSHLGSPGINGASGGATMLEIARTFAAQERRPVNRLRFVWFGAGALGTDGSDAFLASLSADELARTRAMLSLEQLGSPNYVRFVHDAADGTASAGIERLFTDYFESVGLAVEPFAFAGQSVPFATDGIPVGGLATGTTAPKTAAQAHVFGGTTGIAYDPCWGQACDTFANVSLTALDEMSDAAAHVVLLLSRRNFQKNPLAAP